MNPDPRYPIGRFARPATVSADERASNIASIAGLPGALRDAVAGLSDAQLDTPYRAGGWTVRELVHHVADSHINAFCRVKLALSEERPLLRLYDEAEWVKQADARLPVLVSLQLLEPLHERWVAMLRGVAAADFSREVEHPETGIFSLDTLVAMYAWHGAHHVAHVTALRTREGW